MITIRAVRSVCYFVGSDRSPIQAGWPGRRAPDLPTVPDVTEAQLSRGAPFTSRVQKTHREACSPTPAIPPISRHRKAAHKTYRGCNRCITDINCYISTAICNYGDVFRDRIHGPSYRFHTDSARIWGRGRDIDTESASPYLRKAVLSCYPGFYRSKSAPDGFFNTIQSLRTSNPRHYRAPGRTRDPHPAARFPANGRRTIPTPCEPRLSREHMGVRSLGASRLSVRPRLRPHGPARHVGRGGCPRSSPQTRDRAGLHCHDDLMRPCFFRR